MTLKKTDLYKNLGLKVKNQMKYSNKLGAFGQKNAQSLNDESTQTKLNPLVSQFLKNIKND